MEKEEIAQLVATAVGAALAQIVPVVQALGVKVEELGANQTKTGEESEEESHEAFVQSLKEDSKRQSPSKENGFNIQEV